MTICIIDNNPFLFTDRPFCLEAALSSEFVRYVALTARSNQVNSAIALLPAINALRNYPTIMTEVSCVGIIHMGWGILRYISVYPSTTHSKLVRLGTRSGLFGQVPATTYVGFFAWMRVVHKWSWSALRVPDVPALFLLGFSQRLRCWSMRLASSMSRLHGCKIFENFLRSLGNRRASDG